MQFIIDEQLPPQLAVSLRRRSPYPTTPLTTRPAMSVSRIAS